MNNKERIATELMGWAINQNKPYPQARNWFIDRDGQRPHMGYSKNGYILDADGWNPFENPVHATMVLEVIRVSLRNTNDCWMQITICNVCYNAAIISSAEDVLIEKDGDTWMEALCNAVIAYLDGVKDE